MSVAPAEQLTTTGWPWRSGNAFELLDGAAVFFPRMLAAIAAARTHVLLEMYLMSSGRIASAFIEALGAARARGVRCCAVIDGFGALGLAAGDRRRLEAAGVELRVFNPLHWRNRLRNFLRDHRKLLEVDGAVAFVGGAGLSDEFAPGPDGWRELMLEIRGPVVADWQRAFARTWRRLGAELALPEVRAAALPGGARGRLSLSEAREHSVLANGVVRRIDTAQRRVWLVSAYFVPSRRFRKALRRAARRGVDVRLLMPSARTDHPWVRQAARRFYGRMLRNGVRIYEYQPRVLHAKMIICDEWLSLGSSNLDRWSFRWNLEANQEVADARVTDAAAALFAADLAVSAALSRRHWPQRGRLDRLRERIAGALDRWLEGWRRPP
ncbi:MAG TPA: phospholipase D-like domain-containing protein [Steroidobacteraceae bacterium]|nr:phospholipase D-like domain-containing protein [Steroidobacteraceae bacterium]